MQHHLNNKQIMNKKDIIIRLLSTNAKNAYSLGKELQDKKEASGFYETNWFFLHGKLESDVGYDKAVFINFDEIETKETIDYTEIRGNEVIRYNSPNIIKMNYLNGIYNVEVKDIDYPCTGYFWIVCERIVKSELGDYPVWQQRGLVVANDDEKSIEYAIKKYNEKSNIL